MTLGTLNVFLAITLIYATARTINDDKMTATTGGDWLLWLGNKIELGSFKITYGVVLAEIGGDVRVDVDETERLRRSGRSRGGRAGKDQGQ